MTEEIQSPEGQDDGKIAIELAPDQVPEQFRSNPASVFKSYEETRAEMNRLRSQLDEERSQFAAALERIEANTTPAPAAADPNQNQLLTAYQNAVESQDAAAMLSIQLALAQQATAQVIDDRLSKVTPQLETQAQADRDIAFELAQKRVAESYGDKWAEIAPDVQTWLKEHPGWLPSVNNPGEFEKIIREGATVVEGRKAAERLAALEQDRLAKVSAQTATGSGSGKFSTVTDEKRAEWDAVKGADINSYSDLINRR